MEMEGNHSYGQMRKSKLISISGRILVLLALLNQAHSMSWPQVASRSPLTPSTPRSSLKSTALHLTSSPPPLSSSDKGERVFSQWKRRKGKLVLHLNIKNRSRNALQAVFQQWFKQEQQQQRFSNLRTFLQSRPSSSPQHTSVSSPGKMIWVKFDAFFGASPTNSSPAPSSSPRGCQAATLVSRDQRRDCVTSTTQTTGFKQQSEPVSKFQKTPQTGNHSLETLNGFRIDQCQSNILSSIKGTYHWPLVQISTTIRQLCSYNPPRNAIRKCLNHDNILVWLVPDLSMCAPPLQTVLATIITLDNFAEISWYLEELTRCWEDNVPHGAPHQVLEKLREVLLVGVNKATNGTGKMLDKDVAQNIITSLSNILGRLGIWKSNSLLSFVEEFSQNVEVAKGNEESGNDTEESEEDFRSLTLSSEYLAIAAVELKQTTVSKNGLTFTASSENGTIKVSVGSDSPISYGDLLSLPSVLLKSHPRVQFSYYRDTSPFLVKDAAKKLNSHVTAASLNNRSVYNLPERISITLNHLRPLMPNETAVCAFWKYNASSSNPGYWATHGCQLNGTQSTSVQSVCQCDHLTHFGVLVDNGGHSLSPINSYILSILSYMGSSVSIICLSLTILTYLLFHQLRTDFPSRLLLHLAAALFCLHVCFLIDCSLSYSISTLGGQSARVLCTAVGVLLHYSLLSSVSWMGLEALHLHLALVRVFFYTPHRLMKTAAFGWGLPVVVVGLLLIIDAGAYQAVDGGQGEVFCWIRPGLPLGITVIAYLAAVLLMNLLVFIFVLTQLAHLRSGRSFPMSGPAPVTPRQSPSGLQAAGSLASLLGLTWLLGLVAFGPTYLPFMYLFVISNSLQGFCIFLFHCILRPKVRRLWLKQLNSIQRRWICKFGGEKRSWLNFQRAPRPLCSNTSPDPAACLEVKMRASTAAPNG
uniref:adhesion G-protein coupled receptor G6-like n=1 Tax=Myxine glutinosa TaxID=7769 RepID=UPI00358F42AF